MPNFQLESVYYKQSHIPTVKVNTKLTTILVQGKMERQSGSQPMDIDMENLISLNYNKWYIGVVTRFY